MSRKMEVVVCGERGVRCGHAPLGRMELLRYRIAFSVRDRRKISFWKYRWRGGSPLCKFFLVLYVLANFKEMFP